MQCSQIHLPTQISIHTLRMEGDGGVWKLEAKRNVFQSTPSAWRVTGSRVMLALPIPNFNPHPPHGG